MTVSRVLNDASNVRPSTREKVLAAVEEVDTILTYCHYNLMDTSRACA